MYVCMYVCMYISLSFNPDSGKLTDVREVHWILRLSW